MELSRQLAGFIAGTRYEDLPHEVCVFASFCILDWLGSALAGEKHEPAQMMGSLVADLGGAPQASLVTGGRSSVLHAALVNGAASHTVELDDIHKSSIVHAATVVLPAALAVAESRGKSGKDLIAAVVIGYDVAFRIGEAVSPSHYYYWHNTATCGTFGAAAAAAKLLDLNEEQIVHALGNAGTQAAGLWEFIEDGAMTKQLHAGKAAMNGVLAAMLAEKGLTGATRILEGKRGFFRAMAEQFDESRVTHELGMSYKIIENSFKIHASCRHTHAAIDLVLDIIGERPLMIDDIDCIRVLAYRDAIHVTDNPSPNSVYAAKFSMQFCTAIAFLKRSATLDDFTEQNLRDPLIAEVMRKIEVGVDEQIDAQYPGKWGSAVHVVLTSGQTIVRRTDYPKGDPEKPVTGELIRKFERLTSDRPQPLMRHYIEKVMNLDQMPDVCRLLADEPVSQTDGSGGRGS